ncbi:hypothetical protein Sgleb_43210 [Streptomyces glebosus]|uniref:HTH luxR-type domain-containing protein n=1 Tax=Streptomyces glebosus TaxID=249580 RepID=A0A640SZE7_9ACTN|nr:hypothetical protein Sgleb_43210 [Streptomyces glebosus]GHG63930.1 hypothetical protein GCM10010513_31570 [Streptomyces glebosus]
MAGDALISPQITVQLLRQLPPPTPSHPHPGPDALTDRERDIARLVARGFTNQEIATHRPHNLPVPSGGHLPIQSPTPR